MKPITSSSCAADLCFAALVGSAFRRGLRVPDDMPVMKAKSIGEIAAGLADFLHSDLIFFTVTPVSPNCQLVPTKKERIESR